MDWLLVFTIMGANFFMFIWLRTEESSDRRQMLQEASSDKRLMLQLIQEIKNEMKDFHGRLCCLDEKNKKK